MNLSELREKLDVLDDQLLELFLERMTLCEEVAAYKKEHNLPILNRQREREILDDVRSKAGPREREAHHLFSTLMELSRARQAELLSSPTKVGTALATALLPADVPFPQTGTVACQGVEGANSQQMCDTLFPRGNLVYFKSFEAVFSAVSSGMCDFGVLPIENSSFGSVHAVYDLLQRNDCSIVRTSRLCIAHTLMGVEGAKLEDVRQIHSHPQALGQCSAFLASLEGVSSIPNDNTAMAAQMVQQAGDPSIACICAPACAELYGLKPLKKNIQDSDNNYTRFIVIAKNLSIYAGATRLSMAVSCHNKPGALYEILAKLSAVGVNMTKLESCPVKGSNFEFVFYIEAQADLHTAGVVPMLEELERTCESFQLLGAYNEV